MAVTWVTLASTSTSSVNWGISAGNLSESTTGWQTTYLAASDGGTVNHHVRLAGLNPGTKYYYSCGDATSGWSPVLSFNTSPSAGNEFPLTILAWADMGLINSGPSWIDIARCVNSLLKSKSNFLNSMFPSFHQSVSDRCLHLGSR